MSKEKKQMVELSYEEFESHKLRKEFYEDRENDMKENETLLQSMTSEQRKAIEGTIENLQDALLMITECNDLYLTQISKLHESFHAMQSNFRVKQ
jgi:hypothetical protein